MELKCDPETTTTVTYHSMKTSSRFSPKLKKRKGGGDGWWDSTIWILRAPWLPQISRPVAKFGVLGHPTLAPMEVLDISVPLLVEVSLAER